MLNWLFGIAAHWWVALGAFLLLLGSAMVLERTNPKKEIIKKLCDNYVSTDSEFLYDLDKAGKMFGLYKTTPGVLEANRRFLTFHDRIYPFCYALCLVLLLAFFYPPQPPGEGRRFGLLVLLPLLAMVFDFAENQTVLKVLDGVEATGQAPLATLKWARLFTVAKLSLLSACFLLLFGFAVCAQARLRELVTR